MTWLLTAISIYATILNIKKNRYCFHLWAITNTIWAIIDYQAGLYAQSVLFIIYAFLAIIGIKQWKQSNTCKT